MLHVAGRRRSRVVSFRRGAVCRGRILGPVRVGDDVMIGVNVVVAKDVPDRTVLASPSPTVLSHRGSFDYLRYAGDETDSDRSASARLAWQSVGGPGKSRTRYFDKSDKVSQDYGPPEGAGNQRGRQQ